MGLKCKWSPLPNDMTWESYSSKLDKMIEAFPGFTMRLNVNGTTIEMEESEEIGRYQTFNLPEGVSSSAEGMAYIYTTDGIKFKEPVTIAGKTIQNFTASEDRTHLTCTDEGADNVQITQIPLGEAFVTKKGNWFFDTKQMGPPIYYHVEYCCRKHEKGPLWTRSGRVTTGLFTKSLSSIYYIQLFN